MSVEFGLDVREYDSMYARRKPLPFQRQSREQWCLIYIECNNRNCTGHRKNVDLLN